MAERKNEISKKVLGILKDAIVGYMSCMYRSPWEDAAWRDGFEEAEAVGDNDQMMTLRRAVFYHTLSVIRRGLYTSGMSGELVRLSLNKNIGKETRFYKSPRKKIERKAKVYDTQIQVEAIDCLHWARLLNGAEVCVLNMACSYMPGGGVLYGYGAQEEYLFRCSDYFRSLFRYRKDVARTFNCMRSKKHKYPIRPRCAIFTRDVTVFRGTEEEGYMLLDDPFKVNIIAAAAPDLSRSTKLPAHIETTIKNNIRNVLRVAYINRQENLILGAWGCGVFKNPPEIVAKAFKEILNEEEFKGIFRTVTFAIKDDNNSPHGNYSIFSKILNN